MTCFMAYLSINAVALKFGRPGRNVRPWPMSSTASQTLTSASRVRSTAVDAMAPGAGGGVIRTAPRSMAALISRSDRIMGRLHRQEAVAGNPQAVGPRIGFVRQFDQDIAVGLA